MNALRPWAGALLALAAAATAAQDPGPSDFAWRATLANGEPQGLVRLPLPAEALAQLQTRNAADLRVFDAKGQPVAFALATPPRPADAPRQQTASLRALPLHAAPEGTPAPRGTLQMRVDQDGTRQSVWVRLGDTAGNGARTLQATRLPAALFDTRALKEPVSGFIVQAQMPANVPVRFTLSTSADLATWTPVPVQGRIYRFEGDGAPANDKLELAGPLRLQDRYLRLDWSGQEGVTVQSLVGLLAVGEAVRTLPTLDLAAPRADGSGALEWQLPFATPIARLDLGTSRANTLLPVRVLGRGQPAEPWRLLGQTVVYRLGPPGQESINTPSMLHQPSVRWLRVEATHGMRLQDVPLTARVQFEPVELVFPAGGDGPYQVVAGRAGTPSAALPVAMLAATTSTRVDALPLARIATTQVDAAVPSPWQRWLPRGVDARTAGLWLVLLLGVLLLGGVAWSLLRQVNGTRD